MPSDPALLGVNLPWFFGAYGHDLAPNEAHPTWGSDFDTFLAYRPLLEARDLGFQAVRVWLCENGEGIVTRDGAIAGVHPALVESVRVVQECARLAGLRLYWSLLDGNAWARERCALTRAIVEDPAQTRRFADLVAAPLAAAFDPATTLAVEVVNEPEAMTAECIPANGPAPSTWPALGRAIRTIGDALRGVHPAVPVTAGTLHVFLPRLWRAGAGLTALDVHVYHPRGGLPSREDLARYVDDSALADPALPLLAGECGVPDDAPPEEPMALRNYTYNADSRGYSAAFLWRLEGPLVRVDGDARKLTELGWELRATLARRAPRSAGTREPDEAP